MRAKAVVFGLVGIGLLVATVVVCAKVWRFVRQAKAAEGIVVRLIAGGSHPEIEFTTAAGEKIVYTQGGLIFGYRVDERPRVLYRPDDPAGSASVDAFGALWFVPLLLGLIGAFFVVGGALLLARGASAPIG
jgi:hypothetical protein